MIAINIFRRIFRGTTHERGGSMLELSFIAPVMLLISGATIDIGRFLRYEQVANTVSQELANHVYRKCSDLTTFIAPKDGSTDINTESTKTRIEECADAERKDAQLALQNALPGAIVRVSVFRHSIESIFNSPNCTGTGGNIDEIKSDPSESEKQACQSSRSGRTGPRGGSNTGSGPSIDDVARSRLSLSGSAIKAGNQVIATASSTCQRNRLVVVEIGYQFEPIVSFVPKILPGFGPDKDGIHRETTIL